MVVQDFSTFIEVDPNDHVTITPRRVTRTAYQNEDAYVYKDFGIDHFTDFVHEIEVQFDSGATNRTITPWQVANAIDDFVGILNDAAQDYLAVYVIQQPAGPSVQLVECKGTNASNTDTVTIALSTLYYLTITKIGTTLTCDVYTNSARTSLLKQLSITLVDSTYAFQYLYVMNTWNISTNEFAVGFSQNLELNEGTTVTTASGLWPRDVYISGYVPRYQKRQLVGYYSDSGDLRSVETNASGHLLSDIEVEVSSGLFVDGVSGVHVYQESGAVVGISGQHVVVDPVASSGLHVVADIEVEVSSGMFVDGVSGVHVFQESGAVVGISGQHVVIDPVGSSGLYIVGEVHVMSGFINVGSGLIDVNIDVDDTSGQVIHVGCAATIRTGKLRQCSDVSGGDSLGVAGEWCSGPIHTIIVKNLADNANVFVGGANCRPYSGYGFLLAATEAINLDYCKLPDVYVFATASGEHVTYIATDY